MPMDDTKVKVKAGTENVSKDNAKVQVKSRMGFLLTSIYKSKACLE